MKKIFFVSLAFLCTLFLYAQRTTISLNGNWEFDQTEKAFPPVKFTRQIPVPGLIHLATPKVLQYDKFFKKPDAPELTEQFNFLLERDYMPMYNWYRKKIKIGKEFTGQQIYLTIKKSQYVTQVYVNGISAGMSMECYTPIEFNITESLKIGEENEILIQVGDRAWLPSEAAGSTDKEKIHYIPGIWDDVYLTAKTGKLKVYKALFLPSLAKKEVTVKTLIRSVYPPQMIYGENTYDKVKLEYLIREKKSGKIVASAVKEYDVKRDNLTYMETVIPVGNPEAWSTDNPFLYEGEIKITDRDILSDNFIATFGMRDFGIQGKYFMLNGDKFYLRGSNITLQRFFEDPECSDLVWNREWVKKLMIDLPKSIDWNAFRICVGIVPDFWYDLCDEYGIVLQNEWFYWQNHGWDDQIRKEYTNWIWSDGNHPSIVIWDAINENWDSYIGNILIPELKKLDPTRVWDAGYMTDQMANDDMDEPHPYRGQTLIHPDEVNEYYKRKPYNIGNLQDREGLRSVIDAGVPQLVNEYGWIWLWRNGKPSKLTVNVYNYFAGENASPDACRELQAYWLQMETEWLRSERSIAGVLAFCYLTNNYGFTGDWFINRIKDLEVSPAFHWFKHCFAPQAVFIDLVDRRYTKHTAPYEPDSELTFNLFGVNDFSKAFTGHTDVKLINGKGEIVNKKTIRITVQAFDRIIVPCSLILPSQPGGYALITECYPEGKSEPVISRRYIKIGQQDIYHFPVIKPD